MSYHFRNLVFEGGGVKGIAYVGALQELKKRKILDEIERIGGTSAGSITAVMAALRYSPKEISDVLWQLDFNDFKDDSWGVIRDGKRMMKKFGLYRGRFFRRWVSDLIARKAGNGHATFIELQRRGFLDLYMVGTNLSTGYAEVFSAEHTPRMRVADAARISMSIPLFFASVRNERGDVYVDGGVFNNYPVKLFDRQKYIAPELRLRHGRETDYYVAANATAARNAASTGGYLYNRETIGFRLDSAAEIAIFRDGAEPPRQNIDHFGDYAMALIGAVMNVQNNTHLHSDDWHRTIYIDTLGVKTTQFDLSDATKKKLVKAGADGVKRYFDWYDGHGDAPDETPLNKPPD